MPKHRHALRFLRELECIYLKRFRADIQNTVQTGFMQTWCKCKLFILRADFYIIHDRTQRMFSSLILKQKPLKPVWPATTLSFWPVSTVVFLTKSKKEEDEGDTTAAEQSLKGTHSIHTREDDNFSTKQYWDDSKIQWLLCHDHRFRFLP